MNLNKIILILAPHPDDETLGCGGTLLRHKADKCELHWLIGTSIKKNLGYTTNQITERENLIKKVSKLYSFKTVEFLNIPTTQTDQLPKAEIIKNISSIINKIKPNVLYLPFYGDIHSDHRVLFDAAISCTKIFRYPFLKNILCYETLSETNYSPPMYNFKANLYINITDYMNKKEDILKLYKNEISEHPFPRSVKSIKALATLRGSESGSIYSEAFEVVKIIH